MFQAPLLYMLSALTGQQTSVSEGMLSLNISSHFMCPYILPVTLAGTEASLSCSLDTGNATTSTYTVSVAFGHITLSAGGLSVNGVSYDDTVDIGPRQSVSWK